MILLMYWFSEDNSYLPISFWMFWKDNSHFVIMNSVRNLLTLFYYLIKKTSRHNLASSIHSTIVWQKKVLKHETANSVFFHSLLKLEVETIILASVEWTRPLFCWEMVQIKWHFEPTSTLILTSFSAKNFKVWKIAGWAGNGQWIWWKKTLSL